MNSATFNARTQFICITIAIGGLLFGFDTAVISGALEMITNQFSLSTAMEGWLVSSGLVGCIIGVAVTGILSDRLGRRKTILLSATMFLVSAIGCAFPPSVDLLIASRMLGGVGVGMASVICPMLIAEFAPADKRGRMIAYYQLAITVGIVLAYFSNVLISQNSTRQFSSEGLQWFFHTESWRPMFLMMAIPSIIFLALLLKVPESPRWLVAVGRDEKARQILGQLRTPAEADKEMNAILKAAGRTSAALSNNPNMSAGMKIVAPDSSRGSLMNPALRVPLLIGIVLAVFQQFSGINAVIYYGPKIFEAASAGSNTMLFQVIVGAVNLLFTFVAIRTADKYGRKVLLKWGLTGIVLSLFLTGLLFYINYLNPVLILSLILIYIACFAFSLGPVTWIIINEIFPTDVRVKAVSICTLALWVANWIVGQFFPWLLENGGPALTFWLFAACSLVNFIFSMKVVRETKGKTLEEMEMVFVAPH